MKLGFRIQAKMDMDDIQTVTLDIDVREDLQDDVISLLKCSLPLSTGVKTQSRLIIIS